MLAGACALLGAVGCGSTPQDKGEPKGSFAMEVIKASFPSKQSIARPAALELQVRNAGTHTAPGVAAYTVNASSIDTYLTMANGNYNTVVQAWDNCGNVYKTPVSITVE